MTKETDPIRAERLARRQARREKQRSQNIVRAKAMHEYRKQAGAIKKIATYPGKSFVGCSGWYYWHWKFCFYPKDLPSNRWFAFYSSKFKTVELNAPSYSWPTLNTVKTWRRQAGRRKFVYAIKVNELITHQKRFAGVKTLIADFGMIADLLGPYFGCFLFQLPPSFHFSKTNLNRMVNQLDLSRRNVVEFRHRSWWNETAFAAFREAGIIFCSTSGPRLPDELVKTTDEIYIRFHGTSQWYRHDYSDEELQVWADRIAASGAQRVWAYFNNDRDCNAIRNARQLMRLLRKKEGRLKKRPSW